MTRYLDMDTIQEIIDARKFGVSIPAISIHLGLTPQEIEHLPECSKSGCQGSTHSELHLFIEERLDQVL